MTTVSVERTFDAPIDEVRAVLRDMEGIFEDAGFDVECEAGRVHLKKSIGPSEIELDIAFLEEESAAVGYEQIDGPFETMKTRYFLQSARGGTRLQVETAYKTPRFGWGSFLNSALVKRQRQNELAAIGDRLEISTVSSETTETGRPIEGGM
ncbi:MAG: hypothetical protein ABEJ27_05195 [Halodesulfurarchaeum sp.]